MAKKKHRKMGTIGKREMISDKIEKLSIVKQCELISISKSGYYYKKAPMSDYNLELMRRIDEIYLESPEYGSRMIRDVLRLEYGKKVNRKRVQRLMRIMRIQAIYPKPRLSKPSVGDEHKIYPYLLSNLVIDRSNQVWSTDITYIRLSHGFVYLVAIIDWYSRKVLSWELSTSMDKSFCISTLERAIRKFGKPEIFNSDQGSQFTSHDFREVLEKNDVKISMDGKGRCYDNIIIERFWRTLKYGNVFLNDYLTPKEAFTGINNFIKKYNERRPHSSIGSVTPDSFYWKSRLKNEGHKAA